jgi:hypothetical protein
MYSKQEQERCYVTEVDLFVESLNDTRLDEVLKYFGESVPGFNKPSRDQKRRYIRLVFKKQTPKTRKKRNDPLFSFLRDCYSFHSDHESFESDKEVIAWLAKHNKGDLDDNGKLALLMLKYPHVLKEILPTLVQNVKQGKKLFQLDLAFETVEELKEYITKASLFGNQHYVENLLNRAKLYMPVMDLENIEKVKGRVKDADLLTFHQIRPELEKEFSLILINMAFLETHKDEDEVVRRALALDLFDVLLSRTKENYMSLGKKLSQFEEECAELKESIESVETLREENKAINHTIKILKKEKKDAESTWKKRVSELEKQVKDLQEEHKQHNREWDAEKRDLETQWQRMMVKQEEELRGVTIQLASSQMILHEITEEVEEDLLFGVCVSFKHGFLKPFYPEVRTFSVQEWKQGLQALKKSALTKLYIQRDGISTATIIEIERGAQEVGIHTQMFRASTPKQLLDYIGYFKTKERING